MLNSFLEFNFRTHETRQLRVELRVAPLKIMPALKGHGMVSVEGPDGEELIYTFGGSNRMEAVVQVVYVVRDTQRASGVCTRTAEFPAFKKPCSGRSPRQLADFSLTRSSPTIMKYESDEEGDLLPRVNGGVSRESQLEMENEELRERMRQLELKMTEWQSTAAIVLEQTQSLCEKLKEFTFTPSEKMPPSSP